MSLLVVGLSHHSAPVDLLERAALSPDAVEKLLAEVHAAEQIGEAVALVTCNRMEFYADVATFHGGVDEVSELLAHYVDANVATFTSHVYLHYEDSAISHLFHVASGLDSMVVGESQILGQVREAYRFAQAAGTTGRVLGEVFQAALRVGKRSHAETGIDAAQRSVITAGLAQVAPDGVAGLRGLVVGAGSMAALAATTLARGDAEVVVAGRTSERARRLARSVGGTAVALPDLLHALAAADVVISCTGAPEVLLTAELVEQALAARPERPLRVLDVALPHDVDPAVRDLPGVLLADLATLAGHGDVAAPAAEVAAVRAIVADELAAFLSGRRQAMVAPTVVALRAMAADVVARELARLDGRLPELDEYARAEIAATVRRVVEKLLHPPTVRIKELAAEPGGASYEAALRELFALDRRTVEAVIRPTAEPDVGGLA
ncbi:MAG: glutamyl-tRNA reductase [Jiangellaceae bacterium]|nr:glutamyl-tRNA reductase [Jiangellaceae bacterium]